MRLTLRRHAWLALAVVLLSVVIAGCRTQPTGTSDGDDDLPAVVTPKDPDAIRVAVVGDSLLARDCWTCSPIAIPVNGGEEEIRPLLDGDPHIDLVDYDAVPGATLRTHPGLAAAIALAPDELLIDLHVNDAFQVAVGNVGLATVKASIDAVFAEAEAAGVKCVRWISYPTRWTTQGVWAIAPGAQSIVLTLAAYIRGAVASRAGSAAMIEWGPLAERLGDAGISVVDPRDRMHYLNSIAPTFGDEIRRSIGTGCGVELPAPTTTTTEPETP